MGEYDVQKHLDYIAELEKRVMDLESTLLLAKTQSSNSSVPCPLCTYKNGIHIKFCKPHAELDAARRQINDREQKATAFNSLKIRFDNLLRENNLLIEELQKYRKKPFYKRWFKL